MEKISVISNDIYKIISSPSYGFTISMFGDDGNGTISPTEASWYYIKPINAMVQIPSDLDREEVFFWKSKDVKNTSTIQLLGRIKDACNKYGYGFTISDFGNGNLPKKFSHLAARISHENKVQEAYTGTAYRSYYMYENVKMTMIHSDRVDEDKQGARTRKIKDIFIEHSNGERQRFPAGNLSCAKAMVHHLGNGGSWNDRVGQYITDSVSSLSALKKLSETDTGFVDIITPSLASKYLDSIKSNIKQLRMKRSYKPCADKISANPILGKEFLRTQLTKRGLDPENQEHRSFVKHDLYHKYSDHADFTDVIKTTANIPTSAAKSLARSVCFGDMQYQLPMVPKSTDMNTNISNCCQLLLDVCDESLRPVLHGINSSSIGPKTAKFVLALITPPVVPEKEILADAEEDDISELQDLKEWINNSETK